MIIGLSQTRAPTLKRVHSVNENLTLTQVLDRPINLYQDLPVNEDKQASGMVREGKSNVDCAIFRTYTGGELGSYLLRIPLRIDRDSN